MQAAAKQDKGNNSRGYIKNASVDISNIPPMEKCVVLNK